MSLLDSTPVVGPPLTPDQVSPYPVQVVINPPDQPFGGVVVNFPAEVPLIVDIDSGSPVRSVFGRIGDVTALCSDYDSCYAPIGSGVPPGGAAGQVLKKSSSADFSTVWGDSTSGLPPGGTTAQVLAKRSNISFDVDWSDSGLLDNPTALIGLTPVDGTALTGMRSDAAPALDQGINPVWTGHHTFNELADSLLLPTDPTNIVNKQYVDALIGATGSRLLSGGGVAYTGVGLTFKISAATYLINGVQYSSPQTVVTLAAADPTNDRIDVFYVDSSGTAGVITGIPAGPPLEPQVDPVTQLRLTAATVPAGATSPGITLENIYLENTEWTSSTNSAGTINLASTNNPYAGTKDVEATAAGNGNYMTFVRPGGQESLAGATLLQLQIRSKTTWPGPKSLSLYWLNGSSNVGTPVTIIDGRFGFNSANTTSYQQIVIPISLFGTGALNIDRLRIAVSGGAGAIGFYLDNIILQSGGGGGAPPGGDFSTNTNTSVIGEMVLFADTTGKLGKRSTGSGIAALTNGVQGLVVIGTNLSYNPSTRTLDASGGALPNFIDSVVLSGANVSLVNDTATPGNSKYYGTNSGGTLGYYSLPSLALPNFIDSVVLSGGNVSLVNDTATPGNSKYYGTNSGGTLGYFALPSSAPNFIDSIINTGGNVSLVNDTASPTDSQYYGTDETSTRGYFDIPVKSYYSEIWTWTTKTTDANTSGQVGLNTAAWATATQLNINEQATDNRDMTPAFRTLFVTGNQIQIQMKTDATRFARYLITGAGTDHGNWWSFPIAVQDSGGTILSGNTPTVLTLFVQGAGTATHFRTSVTVADGTSITPDPTVDMTIQNNTQVSGTLTVNSPGGSPVEGQSLLLRIKSTNAQTFSWNAIYRGSTYLSLPTGTTGGKTMYIGFARNSVDSKWDLSTIMDGY